MIEGGAEKSAVAEGKTSTPARRSNQRRCLAHSASSGGGGASSAARDEEEEEQEEVEGTGHGRAKGGNRDGDGDTSDEKVGGSGGGDNGDSEDDVVAAGAALSALSTAPHPHKPLVSHLPSQKVADAKRVQDNVFLTTVSSPARPAVASPPARSPPAVASASTPGRAASGGAMRASGAGGSDGARGAGVRGGGGRAGGASGGSRGKKGPQRGAAGGVGGGVYSFGEGASKVRVCTRGRGCVRCCCGCTSVVRCKSLFLWIWMFGWNTVSGGILLLVSAWCLPVEVGHYCVSQYFSWGACDRSLLAESAPCCVQSRESTRVGSKPPPLHTYSP